MSTDPSIFQQALPAALVSTAVFVPLVLMSDRPRGAFIAQMIMALAGAVLFVAIIRAEPTLGMAPRTLAGMAVAALAAALSGMFYHLYLGRFDRVWAARRVFTALLLGACLVLGLLFLPLI